MCMTPGQPHLTLFPYTTLFRSGQGRPTGMLDGYQPGDPVVRVFTYQAAPVGSPEEIAEEAFAICNGHPASAARSEEHTSELQSRVDLVCRLLLEKTNKPPL